jgi:hypothetical protein
MSDNVLFIDYPSGGYGFYLTRLLNRYMSGIVQTDDDFDFDNLGTSHSLPLVYGDIHHNQNRVLSKNLTLSKYHKSIEQGHMILVPYCPGITTDKIAQTLDVYPNSKIIRLYYDDRAWPLVFYNAIYKAMRGDINIDVMFDPGRFGSDSAWARRENFMLLLTSHHLRDQWKPVDDHRIINIDIFSLLTDTQICLEKIGSALQKSINCWDLYEKHRLFLQHNSPTVTHLSILATLDNLNFPKDLTHISELYWQAVFNFYIETRYNISIPVNDFPDWFTDTTEINMLLTGYQKEKIDTDKKSHST